MIPLFKTHYSIGKSILTFNPESKKGGADSVLQIAKENNLDKIFLTEDNMHGFLQCKRLCDENNIHLIFGLRLKVSESKAAKEKHKVVIFGKNDDGIRALYKIYSYAFCENDGFIFLEDLQRMWDNENLSLCIPFYDSFIYYNNFTFDQFDPPIGNFGDVTFFIEDNNLPIDKFLSEKVKNYTDRHNTIKAHKSHSFKSQLVKTVYYKSKSDFKAFQTFKIINNRKMGRVYNLERPDLSGCSSDEFCFESFLKHEK